MGIRRQWKIAKISQISMDSGMRSGLIESIMRRKKTPVMLYAWDANDGTATRAFFTEHEAVRDWYAKKHIWEEEKCPSGVVLHKWLAGVDDILRYAEGGEVRNVPLPPTVEMDVGIVPSSLHMDMQRCIDHEV